VVVLLLLGAAGIGVAAVAADTKRVTVSGR
jgi:hypothetical protein